MKTRLGYSAKSEFCLVWSLPFCGPPSTLTGIPGVRGMTSEDAVRCKLDGFIHYENWAGIVVCAVSDVLLKCDARAGLEAAVPANNGRKYFYKAARLRSVAEARPGCLLRLGPLDT